MTQGSNRETVADRSRNVELSTIRRVVSNGSMPLITTRMDAGLARRDGAATAAEPPGRPVVFVVDDDVSMRESLELLICNAGWQPKTFETAQEFLCRERVLVPSCLVLDVMLPGLNGLDLQRCLAVDCKDMPIIFVTGHADVPTTVQAMKAGAFDFLVKPFCDDALLSAVRKAIERSRTALDRDTKMRELRDCLASLSRREQEVMTLVVTGLLNKQIGHQLGISEITVKAHRGQVMRKMKAGSFADLVKMSMKLGSLPAAGA